MRISDWSSDVCSSDLQDHPESGCGGGQEVYLLIGERSVLRVEKAPLAAFVVEDVLFIPPDGEVRTAGAQFGDQRQRLRIVMLTGKLGAAFRHQPPGAIFPSNDKAARRTVEKDEAQQIRRCAGEPCAAKMFCLRVTAAHVPAT